MSTDTTTGRSWERQPRESVKAYRAFARYCGLGKGRSIARAMADAGARGKYWQAWSAKFRWVERAEAFDVEQLQGQLAARQTEIEECRQIVHNELADMLVELRELSKGFMREGQQQIVTDRDGEPRTTKVIVRGKPVEVAVTKELVSPKTRADILIKQIGFCGIVEPRRGDMTIEVAGLGDQLREGLRTIDPGIVAGLARLFGIEGAGG